MRSSELARLTISRRRRPCQTLDVRSIGINLKEADGQWAPARRREYELCTIGRVSGVKIPTAKRPEGCRSRPLVARGLAHGFQVPHMEFVFFSKDDPRALGSRLGDGDVPPARLDREVVRSAFDHGLELSAPIGFGEHGKPELGNRLLGTRDA